ncbi:hypothetical protein MBLNU457_4523t1 [Dothideomycetes sp. NU457]
MFRAQANQFDELVGKATDENLTSEDWGKILEVCDRVSASPSGPQSAVSALIKRLAHRNANVQLYSLELAHALSQNCGPSLNRELASRSFTDALLRLTNDRNTHQQVKAKVLERMASWTEAFRGNPDLGIMEQAYDKLRNTNPGLAPPSKPVKSEIQDDDRRKEDEELQMALAMSLRESGPAANKSGESTQQEAQGAQPGTTAATVSRVRALYDFTPSEPGELAFRQGDIITVLESVYKDWWKGSLRGATGIIPLNYVEKLQDPTREQLQNEAEMESEVFAQIGNVEKLLALLSVRGEGAMGGGRDAGSDEEITELYHQTLAIRPKLIELIGKYSQKKDDFTQLNEKFIKARRDYEALLESSMSQPQQAYGYPPPGGRHPSQAYQAPYNQPPPQGYPQQPPSAYSPQAHHQGPAAQDPSRYYNQPQSPQPPNNYAYPPNVNGQPQGAAPFHFIPGGAPPPDARQHTPKPHAPMQAPDHGYPPQQGPPPGSDRPQSVYTLNSGNPQELASGQYEPPSSENRNSYPPSQAFSQQAPQQYPQGAPQQGHQAMQMPMRPRQSSLESQSSNYPPQQDGPYPAMQNHMPAQRQQQQQQQQYAQPPANQPPASPPQAQHQAPYPSMDGTAPNPGYQAYHPQAPQQPMTTGGSQWGGSQPSQPAGDDASDYYR